MSTREILSSPFQAPDRVTIDQLNKLGETLPININLNPDYHDPTFATTHPDDPLYVFCSGSKLNNPREMIKAKLRVIGAYWESFSKALLDPNLLVISDILLFSIVPIFADGENNYSFPLTPYDVRLGMSRNKNPKIMTINFGGDRDFFGNLEVNKQFTLPLYPYTGEEKITKIQVSEFGIVDADIEGLYELEEQFRTERTFLGNRSREQKTSKKQILINDGENGRAYRLVCEISQRVNKIATNAR